MSDELPKGFRFAGVSCGIKDSGKTDLALIVSDQPSVAAGVYTQNLVRAASIDWNRAITPTQTFRGIVINSGNANACTGGQGAGDNSAMADELATLMEVESNQIGVLSTGVIGVLLPINNIFRGIHGALEELGSSNDHFNLAANAILTTDKSPKTKCSSVSVSEGDIKIAAMAKGAGMIGPNMATMLAIITTDAKLNPKLAQEILQRVADRSFNRISVEGHTSTNDALMLVASGKFGGDELSADSLRALEAQLTDVCIELAKQIPADGEGASHLIEIEVLGASCNEDAEKIARAIANSALVKTAITGNDPNWGRIVSAAGYCGVEFNVVETSLKINGYRLFAAGQPIQFDEATVSGSISENFETRIELTVGSGDGTSQHWTSDLTCDYVRFNSEYTT